MPEIPNSAPIAHGDVMTLQEHIARRLPRLASSCASYVLGAGISVMFGFITPEPLSLSFYILQNPWIAIGFILVLVVALSLLTFFLTHRLGSIRLLKRKAPLLALQFAARVIIASLGGAIIGVVLGLGSVSSSAPLLVLLRTHPPLGIILMAIFLGVIILAPLFSADMDTDSTLSKQQMSRLLNATAISVVSSLLLLSLISVVVVQPNWCPEAICPVYFNPLGVHDDNLEAVFSTIQSSTFAITGDPTHYTVSTAHRDMPAVRVDEPFAPYRVVLKIDDRQRNGMYPIIIEQVILVIDHASDVPNPLNVWSPGSLLDYHVEPYRITVSHELPGTKLSAVYLPLPGSHVQLQPGGADELDIQVVSTGPTVLSFHLQITYRVANQSLLHTLTLPNKFQVTYSNVSNWHPVTVDAQGRLIPSP